jgi:hypothetical protein
MTNTRWLVVAVLVVILALAGIWFVRRGGSAPAVIDLVDLFPSAVKAPSSAGPDVFAVKDETIAGETKRAILSKAQSRITWKVTLPNDAWLRTAIAIDESAWDKDGDGVQFRIGVSEGGRYDPLLTQHLDPHSSRADRRWVPVILDLSAYGGRTVSIIFNTDASLPGRPVDNRNDLSFWGAPAIVLRP